MKIVALAAFAAFLIAPAARAAETITYTYDANGRLVVVSHSGTVNNGQKHSICYDTADNRTQYKSDSTGAGVTCPNGNPPPPPVLPTIIIGDGGNLEGSQVGFLVSLSNTYPSSVSVNYATATGTAAANDFVAVSGTLTFAAGEMHKTINVSANADSRTEFDETFYVNLSSPTGGATIADSQGLGTIYDNSGGGGNN